MKVTYTGRHIDLSAAQSEKLQTEFEKVGKLLDNGRGEAMAHVILAHEHNENSAEVTVPYHHHELVGRATGVDLFAALHAAVGKLEAQALKVREKWRDERRAPKPDLSAGE
ncbi:MAG: ribosome-associated translation inhibitor RaiA [Terriglobia bacterium]